MKKEATYRYDRNKGHENALALVGTPAGKEGNQVGFELNALTRFIWGIGASANAVYNCGGPFVLFQAEDRNENEKRAKLTTALWRLCKKSSMHISNAIFLERDNRDTGRCELPFSENFEEICKRLKASHDMFHWMRSGDLKDPMVAFEKFKTLSDMELHYLGKLMVKKPIMKDVVHLFMVATKDGEVPSRDRVNSVYEYGN